MDAALLADLDAEEQVLDDLLSAGGADDWLRPTPAEGWTIADTIRHLAVAEAAAEASVVSGRDPANRDAPPLSLPQVADGPGLLQWWRDQRAATVRALAAHVDSDRVPWGGRLMSTRSMATARLMETWAHGLDCFAAMGVEPVDTDRLVHVAWLGWRSLPYAFAVAGETPPAPPASLRLELDGPGGDRWAIGADAAEARAFVTGPAGDWCRVSTQRLRPPAVSRLRVTGDLGEAAVRVARAYL